jgi:hypothetical protein
MNTTRGKRYTTMSIPNYKYPHEKGTGNITTSWVGATDNNTILESD